MLPRNWSRWLPRTSNPSEALRKDGQNARAASLSEWLSWPKAVDAGMPPRSSPDQENTNPHSLIARSGSRNALGMAWTRRMPIHECPAVNKHGAAALKYKSEKQEAHKICNADYADSKHVSVFPCFPSLLNVSGVAAPKNCESILAISQGASTKQRDQWRWVRHTILEERYFFAILL